MPMTHAQHPPRSARATLATAVAERVAIEATAFVESRPYFRRVGRRIVREALAKAGLAHGELVALRRSERRALFNAALGYADAGLDAWHSSDRAALRRGLRALYPAEDVTL